MQRHHAVGQIDAGSRQVHGAADVRSPAVACRIVVLGAGRQHQRVVVQLQGRAVAVKVNLHTGGRSAVVERKVAVRQLREAVAAVANEFGVKAAVRANGVYQAVGAGAAVNLDGRCPDGAVQVDLQGWPVAGRDIMGDDRHVVGRHLEAGAGGAHRHQVQLASLHLVALAVNDAPVVKEEASVLGGANNDLLARHQVLYAAGDGAAVGRADARRTAVALAKPLHHHLLRGDQSGVELAAGVVGVVVVDVNQSLVAPDGAENRAAYRVRDSVSGDIVVVAANLVADIAPDAVVEALGVWRRAQNRRAASGRSYRGVGQDGHRLIRASRVVRRLAVLVILQGDVVVGCEVQGQRHVVIDGNAAGAAARQNVAGPLVGIGILVAAAQVGALLQHHRARIVCGQSERRNLRARGNGKQDIAFQAVGVIAQLIEVDGQLHGLGEP